PGREFPARTAGPHPPAPSPACGGAWGRGRTSRGSLRRETSCCCCSEFTRRGGCRSKRRRRHGERSPCLR
ncbi:MAG: hypothetical protein AVDCRST_MAG89-3341, partial [uncultured Gemmatimonadetes bacterium]